MVQLIGYKHYIKKKVKIKYVLMKKQEMRFYFSIEEKRQAKALFRFLPQKSGKKCTKLRKF